MVEMLFSLFLHVHALHCMSQLLHFINVNRLPFENWLPHKQNKKKFNELKFRVYQRFHSTHLQLNNLFLF